MLPTFKKHKNTIFTYRLQFIAVVLFLLCAFKPNFAQSKRDKILNNTNFKLVSWNIQDLGQSKNTEEIAFMANVLKDFDLVAIQEVVAKHPAGAQKVAELADELNRRGAKWDYRISDPTKSPSVYMSERYAFLWKTSKIDIIGSAYLDKALETKVYREPYIGKFKLKKANKEFYVINFHSRKHDDQPELEIQYFKDYLNRLNSNNIIIAGDFNLNENHPVWNDLYQQGFKAALKNKKTTLKRSCKSKGYLSHAIDNMYVSSGFSVVNSGVIDYIETCNNLEAARKISDHLPVFFQGHMNPN
ncbi:endonuclease/exonuclease/phosphatase family protein [Bizionia sp.]|uniref:endonuclease/exonuclease/phosphatase family protein n=1 Tax=Bizionia sp. TaxID=1954480 RepID=UPI003A9550FC